MMERSIAVKAYRCISRFLYLAAWVRLDRSGNQMHSGGGRRVQNRSADVVETKRAMSGKNDATTWEETTMFRARTIILALGITTTLGSASFAQTPVDPNGAPNP
jgi:hypothetical protein